MVLRILVYYSSAKWSWRDDQVAFVCVGVAIAASRGSSPTNTVVLCVRLEGREEVTLLLYGEPRNGSVEPSLTAKQSALNLRNSAHRFMICSPSLFDSVLGARLVLDVFDFSAPPSLFDRRLEGPYFDSSPCSTSS